MGRTLHEVFRIREVRDRRTGGTVVALNPPDTAAMRGGTAVETVLRKSDELADLEAVAQSWFEDGPDIARAIAGVRARNRAKVVTYLLQSVIARHRDKWADLLLRTALWMREAPLELESLLRQKAILDPVSRQRRP